MFTMLNTFSLWKGAGRDEIAHIILSGQVGATEGLLVISTSGRPLATFNIIMIVHVLSTQDDYSSRSCFLQFDYRIPNSP